MKELLRCTERMNKKKKDRHRDEVTENAWNCDSGTSPHFQVILVRPKGFKRLIMSGTAI